MPYKLANSSSARREDVLPARMTMSCWLGRSLRRSHDFRPFLREKLPPPSLESLLSNEFPAMRERKEEIRRREASGEEYSEKETYGKEGKKSHENFENTRLAIRWTARLRRREGTHSLGLEVKRLFPPSQTQCCSTTHFNTALPLAPCLGRKVLLLLLLLGSPSVDFLPRSS